MSCGCAQTAVPSFPKLGRLGRANLGLAFGQTTAQDATAPSKWSAGPDLLAGGVGFVLPLVYDKLAPKSWPQLKLWSRVALVIGGYVTTAYAVKKLSSAA